MKPSLLVLCFCASLLVSERSQGKTPPATFRDSENLSDPKRKALTSIAQSGNSAAALTLARYYWLVKGDPLLTERYFILAARSGSQKGCDALIAFYVEPGGIFRPKHALTLRRELAKRHSYRANESDEKWAYECSLAFKYSTAKDDLDRRRQLLALAASLGSKSARKELSNLSQQAVGSVRIAPSNLRHSKQSNTSRSFGGVTATFELLDSIVESGKSLTVRLILKNRADSPTEFRYLNTSFIEHIRIYDAENQRVPFRASAPFPESGAATITLRAGETVRTLVSIDVWRYYDLRPGKYFVEFTYDLRLVSDPALSAQYMKRYQSEDFVPWDTKKYSFIVGDRHMEVARGSLIGAYQARGLEPVSYRQAETLSLADRRASLLAMNKTWLTTRSVSRPQRSSYQIPATSSREIFPAVDAGGSIKDGHVTTQDAIQIAKRELQRRELPLPGDHVARVEPSVAFREFASDRPIFLVTFRRPGPGISGLLYDVHIDRQSGMIQDVIDLRGAVAAGPKKTPR